MATQQLITRVEKLVWVLIYGGLFGIVFGIATLDANRHLAIVLMVIGAIAAIAGAVLIWVRSKMRAPD